MCRGDCGVVCVYLVYKNIRGRKRSEDFGCRENAVRTVDVFAEKGELFVECEVFFAAL